MMPKMSYFEKFVSAVEKYVDESKKRKDDIHVEIFHLIIDSIDKNIKYVLGGVPVASFYKSGISGMSRTDGWVFYTPSPVHVGKNLLDVLCKKSSGAHISRRGFTTFELSYNYEIDGTEFVFAIFLEHVSEKFFDTYSCFIDAEILGKKVQLANTDFLNAWSFFILAQPNLAPMWKTVYENMNLVAGANFVENKNSNQVRLEKNDVLISVGKFIAILRTGNTDCAFGTRTSFKKTINGVETTIPLYYVFGDVFSKDKNGNATIATALWILYMEKMTRNISATVEIPSALKKFMETDVRDLVRATQKSSLFNLYREKKWYNKEKFQREISCPQKDSPKKMSG